MSTKNHGGPAFPVLDRLRNESGPSTVIYDAETIGGMTMRQYYKAAALMGIMANAEYLAQIHQKRGAHSAPVVLAANAAEIADAMLAEDEEAGK